MKELKQRRQQWICQIRTGRCSGSGLKRMNRPILILILLLTLLIPSAFAEDMYYLVDEYQNPDLTNESAKSSAVIEHQNDVTYFEEKQIAQDQGYGGGMANSSQFQDFSSRSVSNTPADQDTPPVADFSADTVKGFAPLTVQFQDHSTGNPTAYSWSFDDQSTLHEKNPSFTFTRPGEYTVLLKVSNSRGSDTAGVVIDVLDPVKNKISADFIHIIDGDSFPMKVLLKDQSKGYVEQYLWSFGDGESSDEKNPTHYYKKDGDYQVTLTASNSLSSSTKTIPVSIVDYTYPFARFSAYQEIEKGVTRDSGFRAPVWITFHETSTGPATSWYWDFGDRGYFSEEQHPRHLYQKPGTYVVTLRVRNHLGKSDTSTSIVIK